jgi:hypothetical protein
MIPSHISTRLSGSLSWVKAWTNAFRIVVDVQSSNSQAAPPRQKPPETADDRFVIGLAPGVLGL